MRIYIAPGGALRGLLVRGLLAGRADGAVGCGLLLLGFPLLAHQVRYVAGRLGHGRGSRRPRWPTAAGTAAAAASLAAGAGPVGAAAAGHVALDALDHELAGLLLEVPHVGDLLADLRQQLLELLDLALDRVERVVGRLGRGFGEGLEVLDAGLEEAGRLLELLDRGVELVAQGVG